MIGDSVSLEGTPWHLYTMAFSSINELLVFIEERLVSRAEGLELAITGGGAMKNQPSILALLPTIKPHFLNEFIANLKGLEFIRRTAIPVSTHHISSSAEGEVHSHQQEVTISQLDPSFLFMSLGTGVNFQKFEVGEKGFERRQAEDLATAGPDGFFLGGTSLGAGFLMGLGKLVSGESDYSAIMEQMKEKEEMKGIFDLVMVNLMQMAVSMSILHATPNIFVSGSLLSHIPSLSPAFQKAIELSPHYHPIDRKLVVLRKQDGFLGAIGALFDAMAAAQ
jgi:pantothenate kinase